MAIEHRQPWRLGPRGERWFDSVLASALLLPVPVFPLVGMSWVATLLCVGELVPLYWRRRRPLTTFAVVAGVSGLQAVLVDAPLWGQVAFPVAAYSVARFAPPRWGFAAVAAGLVGAVVASLRWLDGYGDLTVVTFLSYAVAIATVVVASWALGSLGRVRSAYVDTLVERNEQLHREATQRAALAAVEERARIAREMHDVVAHGLSVIVVQADGARYAAQHDPSVVPLTLESIAQTGRAALTEMRGMLGLLRSTDAPVSPQPALADLATLVEDARAAGMTVRATLPPEGAAVPDGIALTAYRVVQEALTNVRKHGGPAAAAEVRVAVHDAVTIEVTDDGRGAAAPTAHRGHGLAGMRERVSSHGGTIATGPAPGGGFRVWARIPL